MVKGLETREIGSQARYRVPGSEKAVSGLGLGGFVLDSKVRLRKDPSLSAQIVGLLEKGASVAYLGRSRSLERVGPYLAYWYHVRQPDGTEGLMFGAYIGLSKKVSLKSVPRRVSDS